MGDKVLGIKYTEDEYTKTVDRINMENEKLKRIEDTISEKITKIKEETKTKYGSKPFFSFGKLDVHTIQRKFEEYTNIIKMIDDISSSDKTNDDLAYDIQTASRYLYKQRSKYCLKLSILKKEENYNAFIEATPIHLATKQICDNMYLTSGTIGDTRRL
jgi:hypothetical protein